MKQIPSFPEDMSCLQECTICFESTAAGPFKYCTCKSILCEACLTKWNRTTFPHLLCPICRRQYGSWESQQQFVLASEGLTPGTQFVFIVHQRQATRQLTPFPQVPNCSRIVCFGSLILFGVGFFLAIVYALVRKT